MHVNVGKNWHEGEWVLQWVESRTVGSVGKFDMMESLQASSPYHM